METKLAAETSEERVKLSFFSDLVKAIVSANTIDQVIQRLMEKIGDIFTPSNWSLLLRDRKSGELYFEIVVGESAEKLKDIRLDKEEGIAGWIMANGQPVICSDARHDSRFSKRIDEITGFRTKSIIGVPLKTGSRILGVIEIINALDKSPFTPFDLQLLRTIADFAAIALENIFLQEKLRKNAEIDFLSDVFNRRYFAKAVNKEIERCGRYGHSLSLLLIDIDRFKEINDLYGHQAGDSVIKNLAVLLKKNVRRVDIVARLGGDEFAVLMPQTGRQSAEHVRTRILNAVEKNMQKKSRPPFAVSIGLHTTDSGKASELLLLTDRDLYREKSGKKEERGDLSEHIHALMEEDNGN
ncbi:MAG: sensor domain-containing diguanylate cyclase [Candidatus Aminicenantes bacterium]|nr:sensor domain-containing diguanylate cyclase [Candidatus Aminicenantes bacterium]